VPEQSARLGDRASRTSRFVAVVASDELERAFGNRFSPGGGSPRGDSVELFVDDTCIGPGQHFDPGALEFSPSLDVDLLDAPRHV
jgi:hypothetical protein